MRLKCVTRSLLCSSLLALPTLCFAHDQQTSSSVKRLNTPAQVQAVARLARHTLRAPKPSVCKEACWAQSASDADLRAKYGSAKIPARFRFADRFYKQGEQVYMSCMKPHGPMAVLNKAISGKCSQKGNQVCTEACKTALSK